MKVFSRRRNLTSYDSVGNISQQDLRDVIKLAEEMHGIVAAWLEEHHPELGNG
jgi:hypothetical protein